MGDRLNLRRFRISYRAELEIDIAQRVLDAIDDDWRETFYNLKTDEEKAAFIGKNVGVSGLPLDRIDGFADQDPYFVRRIYWIDEETEAEEFSDG